jgi:hypothetical protein
MIIIRINKIKITAIILILFCIGLKAQSLAPTLSIGNSGSADNFRSGYTFSYATAGTPWNGSLISYGGLSNNYDTQLSSDYGPNGGNHISYRTRNGDASTWNPWYELAIRGSNTFSGNQIINGIVGIGTTTPNSLTVLDVNGRASVRSILYVNDVMGGNGGDIRIGPNTGGPSSTIFMIGGVDASEVMRVNYNKNVGIGTITPDEKLTVKGKIHTQEVRVDMAGPLVPDYVFANDYKLKSLQEVEEFIKENKHLPEIPSAQEIEKNGLMLAEMNMNLLKKIEELTLYSIEQNKRIESQATEIESLKDLVRRVSKIENQINQK